MPDYKLYLHFADWNFACMIHAFIRTLIFLPNDNNKKRLMHVLTSNDVSFFIAADFASNLIYMYIWKILFPHNFTTEHFPWLLRKHFSYIILYFYFLIDSKLFEKNTRKTSNTPSYSVAFLCRCSRTLSLSLSLYIYIYKFGKIINTINIV